MDRRIIASVLIASGIAITWGIGIGLIAAGVAVAVSGLEVPSWPQVRATLDRGRRRARGVVVAMPRRTAAVVLMVVGVAALVASGGAFAGAGGAFAGMAAGGIGTGAALGRE